MSSKADVYSLGVILYALCAYDLQEMDEASNHKFSGGITKRASLVKDLSFGTLLDFSEDNWKNYSDELKEFVAQCVESDANRRPDAD